MPTWILGVSALYHDAAVALLRDGVLVGAAQEERFSRVKHDPSLPLRATRWLLEEAGITMDDVDHLVFYEKPLRKFERILANAVTEFPQSWRLFPRQMVAWLGDKLWIRDKLATSFGVSADRILFSEHHLSHAASAYFCSPFQRAAVLAVDGVGEWATTSLWLGEDNRMQALGEIRWPHSLGLLYSAITAHLGFAVNNGEYKVMGLASYGEPTMRDQVAQLLRPLDGGAFALDLKYFSHHTHPSKASTAAFEALLGPPRHPSQPIALDAEDPAVRAQSQGWADLAASAQLVLEEALLRLAQQAKDQTGADALCLAGGVALNAVANEVLARKGPFAHMWVQPAAGDAGGALGAAHWAWHMVLNNPRTPGIQPIDLGRRWTQEEAAEYLEDFGLAFEDVGDALAERAATDLADGKVLGWMQGGFEWGPRALGHRSILADPRDPAMKDKLNRSVKFREPFRPFAPMVLEAHADAWFDIPAPARPMLPYMVCTVKVHPDKAPLLGAVRHVDGTARAQVVSPETSPLMAAVLAAFAERTGVPVLVNTSFNLKGDPMVSSPVDAVATFLRSEIDVLYIGRLRVVQPPRRRRAAPSTEPVDPT